MVDKQAKGANMQIWNHTTDDCEQKLTLEKESNLVPFEFD